MSQSFIIAIEIDGKGLQASLFSAPPPNVTVEPLEVMGFDDSQFTFVLTLAQNIGIGIATNYLYDILKPYLGRLKSLTINGQEVSLDQTSLNAAMIGNESASIQPGTPSRDNKSPRW